MRVDMCYAKIFIKYVTTSADDKPIDCDNETDLEAKLVELKKRVEATQIDVFIHNPHTSVQLVKEWRSRATIAKPEAGKESNGH